MTTKTRYPARDALKVADSLIRPLIPVCHRIEIAGSLRRKRPDVGDIELLCIPKLDYEADMFGVPTGATVDCLDLTLRQLIEGGILEKRGGYGPMNKMLRHVESGIPVDVFTATEDNWGMALVVRTGSADYVRKVMKSLNQLGHGGHAYGGITLNRYDTNRREINCPTESRVFDVLGWDYELPENRS